MLKGGGVDVTSATVSVLAMTMNVNKCFFLCIFSQD